MGEEGWRAVDPKEKAARYKEGEDIQDPVPKPLSSWQELVEERIQEAMSSGAFKDLPGRGRPLPLTENPFLDREERPVHRLLKDHGYVPEWIALSQDIRAIQDRCRRRMEVALELLQGVLAQARRRHQAAAAARARRSGPRWWPWRRRSQAAARESRPEPAAQPVNEEGTPAAGHIVTLTRSELSRLHMEFEETVAYCREHWAEANQLVLRYNMLVPLLHLQRRVVPVDEVTETFRERWNTMLLAGLSPEGEETGPAGRPSPAGP